MRRLMTITAAVSTALTILLRLLYGLWPSGWLSALAITAGTIAYHFLMRLAVGFVFDRTMANRANLRRRWYRPLPFEAGLYRRLGVKRWKGRMPSYDPEAFSQEKHSLAEIAGAMCQAELVHESIVALSFLPVLAARWFGEASVFWITSVLAAGVDALFVMMQRCNRPRVVRLLERGNR